MAILLIAPFLRAVLLGGFLASATTAKMPNGNFVYNRAGVAREGSTSSRPRAFADGARGPLIGWNRSLTQRETVESVCSRRFAATGNGGRRRSHCFFKGVSNAPFELRRSGGGKNMACRKAMPPVSPAGEEGKTAHAHPQPCGGVSGTAGLPLRREAMFNKIDTAERR